MVVFTKTASIAPGKTPSALDHAREVAAYVSST
jgi:hypothetical protein